MIYIYIMIYIYYDMIYIYIYYMIYYDMTYYGMIYYDMIYYDILKKGNIYCKERIFWCTKRLLYCRPVGKGKSVSLIRSTRSVGSSCIVKLEPGWLSRYSDSTGFGLDSSRIMVRFPLRARDFSLSRNVQIGSGPLPCLLFSGVPGSVSGGKAAGA